MPRKTKPQQVAAIGYLVVVGAVAAWTWYVGVALLSSEREHLLPDFVLSAIGLPSSLIFYFLARPSWPPLVQTALLTVCALGQAGLLYVLAFRNGSHDKA